MTWRPLARFADRSVGKLWNLRRAERAGLRVPPTVWASAASLASAGGSLGVEPPPALGAGPLIVRSASPEEDGEGGTAAGRFESVALERPDRASFQAAVERVVASMREGAGGAGSHLFVQPLLRPERGGVAFTDGFHFERTEAPGGNRALTAGRERGAVTRGHLRRGEAWTDFVERLARVFAAELASGAKLDLEYAVTGERYVLLQARPARFELRRNPLLSQANHREILGDLPSPWITAALERSGARALDYFAAVDPSVRAWGEAYAVVEAGRPWLNFSFFFRLMDRWGLPRTFVTEGVGGEPEGPLDARADPWRMARRSPRLVALQVRNLATVVRSPRALARFADEVEAADGLPALFDATVLGLDLALTTNFALNGALTGLERVRRALGIRGRARVVTEELMRAFDALGALPPSERGAALDRWIERFGHRGPLESDLARPRFAELRGVLEAQLARRTTPDGGPSASPGPMARGPVRGGQDSGGPVRGGPLFALDRRRESFRDDLMRVWRRLRERILEAARAEVATGRLEAAEDVFLLVREELDRLPAGAPDPGSRRAERADLAALSLPHTATRDAIRAAAERSIPRPTGELAGVALGSGRFEGRVVRADELVALLERDAREDGLLGPDAVLVAPALEPSWAVVLGRVGAVVTELGGELSHVAILLREAGVPSLLNVGGACAELREGQRIELDLDAGRLR